MPTEEAKQIHIAELEKALKGSDNLDKTLIRIELNSLLDNYDNDAYFQRRMNAWND